MPEGCQCAAQPLRGPLILAGDRALTHQPKFRFNTGQSG